MEGHTVNLAAEWLGTGVRRGIGLERRYRLIAAPEAAGAIGLLVGLKVAPLGIAAAVGLVALMAGAVSLRARVHDAGPLIAGDAIVMIVAGVTAALRVLTA